MKKIFMSISFMSIIFIALFSLATFSFAEDVSTTQEAATSTKEVEVEASEPVLETDVMVISTDASASTDTGTTKMGFLSMGQDNLYLAMPGESAFLAVGAGFDILSWEKSIGSKGGKLSLTLHGTAAARVTGNDSSAIAGGSINIDIVKLFNGTGVNFLLNNFKCVIGPAVVYDANKGKMGYGGLLNFSYTID